MTPNFVRHGLVPFATVALATSGLALLACAPATTSTGERPAMTIVTNTTVPSPPPTIGEAPLDPVPIYGDRRDPLAVIDSFLAVLALGPHEPERWSEFAADDLTASFDPAALVPSEWPPGQVRITAGSSPQLECTPERCELTTLLHTQLLDADGHTLADSGYRRYRFTLDRHPHDRTWQIANIRSLS